MVNESILTQMMVVSKIKIALKSFLTFERMHKSLPAVMRRPPLGSSKFKRLRLKSNHFVWLDFFKAWLLFFIVVRQILDYFRHIRSGNILDFKDRIDQIPVPPLNPNRFALDLVRLVSPSAGSADRRRIVRLECSPS